MKTMGLKKPTYIGTGAQVAAMRAEKSSDGKFSDRKTAGRIAAGLYMKGEQVAITRMSGRRAILTAEDAKRYGVEAECVATLSSVDRKTGEVILTIA